LLVAALLVVTIIVALTQRMTREITHEFAQREALAAVGEFASELAHEVRNPLTAIRLDLQRVEEAAGDETTVRGIVPRVLRQIERLDRAVSGALRVARSGSTTAQAIELADVLESARRAAEPEFNHRRATLSVDSTTAKCIALDGDAGALEQMFLNLLINASHALPPGGEARVATSERDGVVEVTVTDNGGGMSPQQLERVQEPFRSTKRDGTGLGLKIARRIATSHRGELALESGIGKGTTVRVTLPRRADR
jgi:signal transduction histidine kinase